MRDQKWLIKNRLDFEKHFGREPRPNEEKYVSFLKLYEEQRERQEFTIRGLEKETDRLNQRLIEFENENFALSKGKMPGKEAQYFTKGDGKMSLKLVSKTNY